MAAELGALVLRYNLPERYPELYERAERYDSGTCRPRARGTSRASWRATTPGSAGRDAPRTRRRRAVIFTEPRFLVFFLVVYRVYWALRTNGPRKLWLLGASCTFYCAWDWRFLGCCCSRPGSTTSSRSASGARPRRARAARCWR
jgi:hypothetical protein